jgi:hypothetical protein
MELVPGKEYVVVTRALMKPSGRLIVHVYGLYSKNKAKSVKHNIKAAAVRDGHQVEVHACHVIDIDAMNLQAGELPNGVMRP